MHVFRGTPQDMMHRFISKIRDADSSGNKREKAFQDALVSLVGLQDRLAEIELNDGEVLTQFREASCAELMKFSEELSAYSDITMSMAKSAAHGDEWYELCIRCSIIQILMNEYAGTPIKQFFSIPNVCYLQDEVRKVGMKQQPIPQEHIPKGLNKRRHWWWHYSAESSVPPYDITVDRRAFLSEYERLLNSIQGRWGCVDYSEPSWVQSQRAERMGREYSATVPKVSLSRCPFCGQVNAIHIDIFGLDGPWWIYPSDRTKIRRGKRNVCPHFLNLLGAVKLQSPLHYSSKQVKPGPGVPFVAPELIQPQAVKAVVSQIPVGENIAYPIFYYSDVQPTLEYEYMRGADVSHCRVQFPDQKQFKMPSLWRTDVYKWVDKNGKSYISDSGYLFDKDCDFELAPWIEAGKLLWINPGDESLTLHNTLNDCPYVDLPGLRHHQWIQYGAARYYEKHIHRYSFDGKVWMTEEEYDAIRRARKAQNAQG